MKKPILLLGDEALYVPSDPVRKEELPWVDAVTRDLHDTLLAFRAEWGAGRAIAAPQIGVRKRLIYMFIDKPVVFINPVLTFPDEERMEVLDDCMSFPHLLVRVLRHCRCDVQYLDMAWGPRILRFEGDLAELIQHEADHLDGVLATMRAVDERAFVAR